MQTEAVDLPVSHKMWAWFETNKKQAGWAALAIIVVSCIVVYVVYQRDQKQVDAGEALSSVTIPQVTGLRQGDVTPAYMKVASEYPKSPAGLQALLLAAADLFEKGKYAEAQQQFERIVREHRESPLLSEAMLGVAASLDAQGKTAEATTAYKNLVDRQPNAVVAPQARFALARLYEASGKFTEARGLFEEVERSNPYGSLGSEAGIRLEELKSKHPEAFPAPAPLSTNGPSLTIPTAPVTPPKTP
jgi:predicted negative regulator of RcsB-dependent stress response